MCSIQMWFLSQMIFAYVRIAFLPGIFVAEFLVVAISIFQETYSMFWELETAIIEFGSG